MRVGWATRSREITRRFVIGRADIQLEWKPADLWVGVFFQVMPMWQPPHEHIHVWVCLLPTLPIHVHWVRWSRPDAT